MTGQTPSLQDNPLFTPRQQPFNAPPLGLFGPEHLAPAAARALEMAREDIEAIATCPDEPDFENTIAALAFSEKKLYDIVGAFSEMKGVCNSPEVQQAWNAVQPVLTDHAMSILLDERLFKRVKAVYDASDLATMDEERWTLLLKTYNGFANNGALLQGAARDEFERLAKEAATVTTEFSNNLVNGAAALKLVIKAKDKARLAGIPEDFIASYSRNAQEDPDPAVEPGDYVITMTPPPHAVFEYAQDRSLRQEVRAIYNKIGSEPPYDNTPFVHRILELRHRIARLLGYSNAAQRIIRPDTRMAGDPQTVMDFLRKNASIYRPAAQQFYKELADFAQQRDGITELKAWDRAYYIRLMREEQIGFDPEQARPYFELETVLKGMFGHAEKLYGITVREAEGSYSKLHPSIRTYEILDAQTQEVKALYFLDPYARKHKHAGAWMSDIRNAGLHGGKREIPIAGNYCNFNEPAPGQPSLLDPGEVTTLFHEFGHACHCMMGKGTYPGLTGTSVLWDYVELPSQVNERWAFKPEVLATYAMHHETGDPIPQDMIDRLQKLEHFNVRWQGLRQTELGLLDMALHTADPAAVGDLLAFQEQAWRDTAINPWDGPPMVLSFSHIMAGGYSAGYYGYKWADALVADVFEQFEEKGIYNPSLCEAFRKTMIEPGGTRPPAELLRDFMEAAGQGRRDLDPDALYRAEGLAPSQKTQAGKPPAP